MGSNSRLRIHEWIARRRKLIRKKNIATLLFIIIITAVLIHGLLNAGSAGTGRQGPKLSDSSSTASSTSITEGMNAENNAGGDGIAVNIGSKSGITGGGNSGKDLEALKKELENYISKFTGRYGIYFINLVTWDEFGINDTEVYIAASTVKVPLNLYLFKMIEKGEINPEDTMTYLPEDYEGGSGSIQYNKVGTKYKIRELSKLSIEVSDNVATNMLLRLIGRETLRDYMRSLGGTVVMDDVNASCPRDMALYLKEVYDFYNSNKTLGGELMGYLQNTVFNDRLPKLLPKNVKVAHKIGNQVGAVHDVGIVFAKEPYIIAVMSQNVDESESYDVIANISKKVYDFVTK